MIAGIIMVLTLIWVYQAIMKVKKPQGFYWVAGCAVIFLAVQFLFMELNQVIIGMLEGQDVGGTYDATFTGAKDRDETASGGWFMNSLYEILPPFAAFLSIAFVRTKFILKEALSVSNLFGGIKDLFISIKNSFKTSE